MKPDPKLANMVNRQMQQQAATAALYQRIAIDVYGRMIAAAYACALERAELDEEGRARVKIELDAAAQAATQAAARLMHEFGIEIKPLSKKQAEEN